MDINKFKIAVQKQFASMAKGELKAMAEAM